MRGVQHVALLRGIGPGNPKMRNVVLIEVLSRAGFEDVRSVISSGNYLFRSEGHDRRTIEQRMEAALAEHLGSHCVAIVRSRRQMEGIAALDVFDGEDDGPTARCNVTFLQRRPPAGVGPPADGDGYRFVAAARQSVFCTVDSSRSQTPAVMAALEATYGKQITTRTWKTVHRIVRAFDA